MAFFKFLLYFEQHTTVLYAHSVLYSSLFSTTYQHLCDRSVPFIILRVFCHRWNSTTCRHSSSSRVVLKN